MDFESVKNLLERFLAVVRSEFSEAAFLSFCFVIVLESRVRAARRVYPFTPALSAITLS